TKVDVRVVAATDADLEGSVACGTFSGPLYHRLAAHTVHLPPLRHRRDDLGRLLLHFLRLESEAEGIRHRLEPTDPDAPPWLGAALVTRLALHAWPGNVRELRNAVSQLVLYNLDRAEMEPPPELDRILPFSVPRPATGTGPFSAVPYRDARRLSSRELEEALERHAFEPSRAAAELGVARPSLYKRIEALGLPTAASLSADDILRAAEVCDGDTERMALQLRVSGHGLKMRMKALGLH
ncbi:MAG: sigma 54-interacting transcriptional regulator, partial [Holophagales bacterium]|nr:sigma 54-interacting transcriptional regulator [Holophagales bacterium]